MGWVGYFLPRYPRSWNPEPRSGAPPEPKSDAPPIASAPATEDSQAKHGARASTPPSIEIEEDESQTTPKASAANAPPAVLTVPALNLDEDSKDPTAPEVRPPTENSSLLSRDNGTPTTDSPQPPSPSRLPPQQSPSRLANTTTARTSSLMMPPPVPRQTSHLQPPRPNSGSSLHPQLSAAATQRRLQSSGSGLSNSSTLAPTQLALTNQRSASSRRVILEPGYSPLDWAARTSNPNNQLRGAGLPPGLLRVTPSMLKTQNGRKGRDAWTSYQGKVYNISPYLPYHPGGKGQLLRGAGKDAAKLFQEIHPWVNWDGILRECLVGILVSENDAQSAENRLDAMD